MGVFPTLLRRVKYKQGIEKPLVVILLTLVTIVVTISVAFWMGGVASIMVKREQIEISNAYVNKSDEGVWIITVQMKNTGTADSNLDILRINGKDSSEFNGALTVSPILPLLVQPGSNIAVIISVKAGTSGFILGGTVDLVFCSSSSGLQYPKQVILQ